MNRKFYLKDDAILLRKKGYTYPEIEEKIHVPRATLSGWLQGIPLSKQAKLKILVRKRKNLSRAREKAVAFHITKNQNERESILKERQGVMNKIHWTKDIKEILLGVLYLGEGSKARCFIGLGNSNSHIMKMFVSLLRDIYTIDENKFRVYLYLRADQNEEKEKKFWSKTLNISLTQFRKVQFDKRTLGKKTWIGYHGVCVVNYYDAKIEKRLTAVQDLVLKKFS